MQGVGVLLLQVPTAARHSIASHQELEKASLRTWERQIQYKDFVWQWRRILVQSWTLPARRVFSVFDLKEL